ncbi:cytochrome c [Bacteroidales bacterium AH-315-N07]|nr:cytochrome c [Bacteroidales bacterium AH-315-N07]
MKNNTSQRLVRLRRKIKSGSILSVIILLGITSCTFDPNDPGWEYIPDMARTAAYKTYVYNPNFSDSSNALLPPEGTIARGHSPYSYEKNDSGYQQSANLVNPVDLNDNVLAEGKRLYGIYCSPCHGKSGNGDGLVVTKGGMAIPPKYTDKNAAMTKHDIKNMTAGQIYHIIMVGSTIMGSYASQLSENERWHIVHYIQKLQGPKEEKIEAEVDTKKEEKVEEASKIEPSNEGSAI